MRTHEVMRTRTRDSEVDRRKHNLVGTMRLYGVVRMERTQATRRHVCARVRGCISAANFDRTHGTPTSNNLVKRRRTCDVAPLSRSLLSPPPSPLPLAASDKRGRGVGYAETLRGSGCSRGQQITGRTTTVVG